MLTVAKLMAILAKLPPDCTVNMWSEQDVMGTIITPTTGEIRYREDINEVDIQVVSSCQATITEVTPSLCYESETARRKTGD